MKQGYKWMRIAMMCVAVLGMIHPPVSLSANAGCASVMKANNLPSVCQTAGQVSNASHPESFRNSTGNDCNARQTSQANQGKR